MDKKVTAYGSLVLSIILILLGSIVCSNNGATLLVLILRLFGFLTLLIALELLARLLMQNGLIDLINGKEYEKSYSISIIVVYFAVIFNSINMIKVGIPLSIIGLGLIIYSMVLEKEYNERSFKDKVKEVVEKEKKIIEKKVETVKKEIDNKKKTISNNSKKKKKKKR